MDRPTGRVIRRIETSRVGEPVHIDVKKLARVPAGCGHKMLGRTTETARGGYSHIHTATIYGLPRRASLPDLTVRAHGGGGGGGGCVRICPL